MLGVGSRFTLDVILPDKRWAPCSVWAEGRREKKGRRDDLVRPLCSWLSQSRTPHVLSFLLHPELRGGGGPIFTLSPPALRSLVGAEQMVLEGLVA